MGHPLKICHFPEVTFQNFKRIWWYLTTDLSKFSACNKQQATLSNTPMPYRGAPDGQTHPVEFHPASLNALYPALSSTLRSKSHLNGDPFPQLFLHWLICHWSKQWFTQSLLYFPGVSNYIKIPVLITASWLDPNWHRMVPIMTLEDRLTQIQFSDWFGCSPRLQCHVEYLANRNTVRWSKW